MLGVIHVMRCCGDTLQSQDQEHSLQQYVSPVFIAGGLARLGRGQFESATS